MCVSDAESLSNDPAGESCFLFIISAHFVFGARDNRYILYDCLYAVLFYDFAAGMEDGIDRRGRFSVRKYHTSAVFPEKIFIFSGAVSVCLYAECSIPDIQRRSCRSRNISVHIQTDFLAGDIDVFGNCPMEAGGKKSHITRRLIP